MMNILTQDAMSYRQILSVPTGTRQKRPAGPSRSWYLLLSRSQRKPLHAGRESMPHWTSAPCGRVLQPTGDLPFEEAVEIFSEIVRAGAGAGADLILLETFTDLYELKAALIAVKENSDLPVLATMSFEENGTSFFGATVESMALTLQALGADALGVNCSLGPRQLVPIVERLLLSSSIPVMVQPNAGLPIFENGEARYDVTTEEFADHIKKFAEDGALIVGGCCGTDPDYMRLVKERLKGVTSRRHRPPLRTGVCSPSRSVFFGEDTLIIGERLNPTGKKTLQAALRAKDMDHVLKEAIRQQEQEPISLM